MDFLVEIKMVYKKIVNTKNQKLSKFISDEIGVGYNKIQKIIRNKDVKVDGKRVSQDIDLENNQVIEIFLPEEKQEIVFKNEDIVIAFKKRNIETINNSGNDLITKLSNQLNENLFAVHRLDRNTEGLVIFAKNVKAKDLLDNAIRKRKIEKYYLAKVIGVPEKKQDNLVAYLRKDEKNSRVYISDTQEKGYEIIKTNYKLLSHDEKFSVLEVELVTGKTHQIRAHLSHIGLPILGDEKYGNSEINKRYNKKYQCLCAYKLIFHFDSGNYLSYLNEKIVELSEIGKEFC